MPDLPPPPARPLWLDALDAGCYVAGVLVGHVAGSIVGEVAGRALAVRDSPRTERLLDGAAYAAVLPLAAVGWLGMAGATLAAAPPTAVVGRLVAGVPDPESSSAEALRRPESA